MVKKLMKRVLSLSATSKGKGDEIALAFGTPGPMPETLIPPSGSRRRSLPAELACEPMTNSPKPNSRRRKQLSARRQQKIKEFLKQGSFAKRTWEGTAAPPTTPGGTPAAVESQSSSTISLSSDSDDNEMDGSNVSAPVRRSMPSLLLDVDELENDGHDDFNDEMDGSNMTAPARSNSTPSLTDLVHERSSRRRRSRSTSVRRKKQQQQQQEAAPPTIKKVQWDEFVERDQTKRELSRQFRSALPEWKQRQMAHRVHHCNVRKRELEAFQKEFAKVQEKHSPQEIQVAPAAGGWFERNDRDISAEFLMMDVDLFGNKKRDINAGRSVASF